MQMRVLSTRTMAEDDDKHKNNGTRTMISTRTMQMRLLSTRTIPNEVAKHKNSVNEVSKYENDGK